MSAPTILCCVVNHTNQTYIAGGQVDPESQAACRKIPDQLSHILTICSCHTVYTGHHHQMPRCFQFFFFAMPQMQKSLYAKATDTGNQENFTQQEKKPFGP